MFACGVHFAHVHTSQKILSWNLKTSFKRYFPKKVILKCAFEVVQKLVWEHLKKSSAQNVEILLISSSQKTSLNTYNSNLRKLVDKQLLEIKKNTLPFFLFQNLCSCMFFSTCRITLRTQAGKQLFLKKFLCIYFLPVSLSTTKVQIFSDKTSESFAAPIQKKIIKIDFFTNPTSKCCSENWKLVLRTQAGNFLLEQQLLFDFVTSFQLKVFPNLLLWTVMNQFEVDKRNKLQWMLKRLPNVHFFQKSFPVVLCWHVVWPLFSWSKLIVSGQISQDLCQKTLIWRKLRKTDLGLVKSGFELISENRFLSLFQTN